MRVCCCRVSKTLAEEFFSTWGIEPYRPRAGCHQYGSCFKHTATLSCNRKNVVLTSYAQHFVVYRNIGASYFLHQVANDAFTGDVFFFNPWNNALVRTGPAAELFKNDA